MVALKIYRMILAFLFVLPATPLGLLLKGLAQIHLSVRLKHKILQAYLRTQHQKKDIQKQQDDIAKNPQHTVQDTQKISADQAKIAANSGGAHINTA